jgi:hypothetical protein
MGAQLSRYQGRCDADGDRQQQTNTEGAATEFEHH